MQGVEGLLRDVTARKRAEAALIEAEERARHLLESVGEGIFGVDRRGQVTFMNPVAEEMLGWTAAELYGVRVHDAIHYAYEDGSAYPADKCHSRPLTWTVWSAAWTMRCSGAGTAPASPSSTSPGRS